MFDFCLMIKSYRNDFDYCMRLVASINRFNVDNVPTYIVVEKEDLVLFSQFTNDNITVLATESIPVDFVETGFNGISPGYINQEIVKLAFWKLQKAKHYLCLDSDGEFIRPFSLGDFMASTDEPYTFLTEDRNLQIDRNYFDAHWVGREILLRKILVAIDYKPKFIETCHNHQVFSSHVLQDFEENFLSMNKYSYSDILKISPYEFSWYNFWLQKRFPDNIHKREPNFLIVYSEQMELTMRLQGIIKDDISRGYVGLILNSNYSRGFGVIESSDNRIDSLARLIGFNELLRIFTSRVKLGIEIKFLSRWRKKNRD